mmetsp:Transcript_1183/g.2519  ORF Transcript_1183/g.2519 Transcript_1183/m.2519 type:complete len:181 (+) Transcript_1183:60-602(+)
MQEPPVPVPMGDFEFYSGWVPTHEADSMFARCLSDVPWATKKWSLFYTLPQLAYYYGDDERKKTPIPVLEEIIGVIEQAFDTRASVMWCNLYEDGNHHMEWHQDQYGEQCFVLSLGASRPLDWRVKKSKVVLQTNTLGHGDLYYFNQTWDKEHEHRVPKVDGIDKRLSFVLFTQPPFSGR